jgi:hypothetical protein
VSKLFLNFSGSLPHLFQINDPRALADAIKSLLAGAPVVKGNYLGEFTHHAVAGLRDFVNKREQRSVFSLDFQHTNVVLPFGDAAFICFQVGRFGGQNVILFTHFRVLKGRDRITCGDGPVLQFDHFGIGAIAFPPLPSVFPNCEQRNANSRNDQR